MCTAHTCQSFTPPNIGGSVRSKAVRVAEKIAEEDYGVSNFQLDGQGGKNKVHYKDDNRGTGSHWGMNPEALQMAAMAGKQTRLEHGSGLDVIKTMPDYIANSKKLSAKIW